MKTEEFENAKEKDLRRKANECFEKLDNSGSHEKPALLIEAQFYMDEIERRKQDSIAMRDLILELVVIALIALELYFGITGGNQQLDVLQKLNKSATETASTLTTLSEEQKAVLRAIDELNRKLPDEPSPAPQPKKAPHSEGG